ncbi:MAG: hypothetical protein IT488_03260 [Gammaproteobacteria bacterium]|nr:hypothetical protein [Gammaproteobacteria bacterium]HMN13373.1 hypothetical protein [Bellilinea sp.]
MSNFYAEGIEKAVALAIVTSVEQPSEHPITTAIVEGAMVPGTSPKLQ